MSFPLPLPRARRGPLPLVGRTTASACVLCAASAALLLAAIAPARAQSPGAPADSATSRFAALVGAARATLAADAGRLWGARLDTIAWMGIADRRLVLSADPRLPGFAPAGGVWTGPLPDSLAAANTAVTWAGRRWAMVRLPLPADSVDAVRLLLHEGAHAAQPDVLPSPVYREGGAGAALLDRPEGRLWLQLEWRALARALETSDADARAAAADALLFRARRYAEATPDERVRERVLDLVEGLPEYTAWRLTAGPTAAAGVAVGLRARAPALQSYVRGFPYHTGPAYALLLDRWTGDGWRRRVAAEPDLQRMLATALPDVPAAARRLLDGADATAAEELRPLAEAAAGRYGGDELRLTEERRWAARERQLAAYRARFVDGPTLRLRPAGGLRVTFDPRGQQSLGDAGTVMLDLGWKGAGGAELRAPDGALVAADWTELRVPLGAVAVEPGPVTARTEWRGEGWTLVLPPGWTISADGASRVLRPPPE